MIKDKEKFILPVSIVLMAIILGGFYYSVESNKLHAENRRILEEREIEKKKQFDLEWCLATAEGDRKDYLRINGPDGHIDGRMSSDQNLIKAAQENKSADVEECYRLYQ